MTDEMHWQRCQECERVEENVRSYFRDVDIGGNGYASYDVPMEYVLCETCAEEYDDLRDEI